MFPTLDSVEFQRCYRLSKATQVGKARIDVQAEVFLRELKTKHLEAIAEIGIRNEDSRSQALIKRNDSTVDTIREVLNKDWPQSMIDATISQIMLRQKAMAAKIMTELGTSGQVR